MIGAVQRYLELITELLLTRGEAGGSLPDDLEVLFIEKLDQCWASMTPEERKEAEDKYARDAVVAETLDLEEQSVEPGESALPRKAAA